MTVTAQTFSGTVSQEQIQTPITTSLSEDKKYCADMLPLVSRTFAACIKLLPQDLDHAVLIAYLLCRIADTIEDTARLSASEKEQLLHIFIKSVHEEHADLSPLTECFKTPKDPDQELTRDAHRSLRVFWALPQAQRDVIRPWVIEMCEGMASFAQHYPEADPDNLQSLASVSELDRYCYYVAGTVGHLLTDLFALHHPRVTPRHINTLKSLATSFGLGLQLTNIIKDVADDAQRGWSFVPHELCAKHNIHPRDLLNNNKKEEAKAVMRDLIAKASGHLSDALDYCLSLPRSQYRIRLFCLTPLYFAIRTLRLAERDGKLLDPKHKVKITRPQVKRTLIIGSLVCPSNTLVRLYYRWLNAGN